jgi:hypothetical protein
MSGKPERFIPDNEEKCSYSYLGISNAHTIVLPSFMLYAA